MWPAFLVWRLAVADMRRHPVEASLLLMAITAATATLTLGLVLHGVTNSPYQRTRSVTGGPDVVAGLLNLGKAQPPSSKRTDGPRRPLARIRGSRAFGAVSGGLGETGRARPERGCGGRRSPARRGEGRPAARHAGTLGQRRGRRSRAGLRRCARHPRRRQDHSQRPTVPSQRTRHNRGRPQLSRYPIRVRRPSPVRRPRPDLDQPSATRAALPPERSRPPTSST